MILKSAFHIIILMTVWPICPLASAQDPIIAKPGCDSSCGNVDIAYPFGMNDPNCYVHKWFEIDCRNTSQGDQKPYLKSMNLEVTNIYENLGTVEIMNPVYRWNCQSKNASRVIDLRGSPFVYSQDYDTFVAVACNSVVFLGSNGSAVGGCVSICNDDDDEANIILGTEGCRGMYCCETSLPQHLSEYNATLQGLKDQCVRTNFRALAPPSADRSSSGVSDPCNIALIVNDDWLKINYYMSGLGTQQSFSNLKNMDYVPAMLEWEILNDMLTNSTLKFPSDAICNESNITQNTTSGWRCHCPTGYEGNPYIQGGCIAERGHDKKSGSKWAIVGVSSSLGSIILLIGVWLLYKVVTKRMIKKRKEKFFKKNGGLLLQQRLSSSEVNVDKAVLFSLKELEKATDNFNLNRVLGKGGQGTVYKGMLVDGRIIAVKRFKVQGKAEEFINEFVILSQINHRNVVKLLGCCLETEIPLLVYEFIPNGNLFEYLHDQNEDLLMTWDMRVRIATEIAGALFYLHSVASQPIYHRDIKTTNILLDEKYRAKVADFGTSRIVSTEATHLTTVVQGTFGYLDPEYFYTSQFTEKSDVYSYGVVLVELLTGQKPISSIKSEETKSLASYFVVSMEEKRLFDIIDKRVMKEGEKKNIAAVANLAYRCLDLNGKKRPTMKEVTLELEGIRRSDRMSNIQQNQEEIELARFEDYQPWAGYSTSDTFATTSSRELSSEVMPILTLK